MRTEIWKHAVNHPNYEVSNLGNVRRIGADKPLAGSISRHGYHRCALCHDGVQKTPSTHRLVAEAFLGPKPNPNSEVNHKNGVKTDNRAENLEWVSRRENFRHAEITLGSMKLFHPGIGSKHHKAILSEADIPIIRKMFSEGIKPQTISERFGIKRASVYAIVNRVTWRHVA